MSFSGAWSTGSIAPTSSGGGGWTTGAVVNTSGGWGGATNTGSSGGWSAPTITQASYAAASYSTSGNSYSLPGAGLQVGPFGEGGPYTPIDFPLLHELRPGERLEDLQGNGTINRSIAPYLIAGVVAFLLLKKR